MGVTRLREDFVSGSLPFVDTYGDAGLGLLGDPSRRAIFELLARRASSVGELAEQLPISRPAVSQHLRVLKDGGLVVSEAQGTRRVYRLNPPCAPGWTASGTTRSGLFRRPPRRPPSTPNKEDR